jgi:hypothetical protein
VTSWRIDDVLETVSTENVVAGKYAHSLMGVVILTPAEGAPIIVVRIVWISGDDLSSEECRFGNTQEAVKETPEAIKERYHG